MNKSGKVKFLRFIVVILILFLIVAGAGLWMFQKHLKEANEEVKDLSEQLSTNTKTVFIALDDLPAGTILEKGVNVELEEIVSGLPESMYFMEEDMGKSLLIPVNAWEPIMANMVTDEIYENDTREVEVSVCNLLLDSKPMDFCDIRILFADGSDYCLASKVKIKKLSLENNIFYCNMGEDEILTLSAATIDAFTISGTKIYLTRYVAPNNQEKTIPNYPVRQETLLLMGSDPNILHRAQETLNAQARAALESRLALLTEDQRAAVAAGFGLTDTAHAQAFIGQEKEEVTVYEDGQDEVIQEGNNE